MEFTTNACVASDALLWRLREEYARLPKPGTWPHSVLTQAFQMPNHVALEVLEGRACIAKNKKTLLVS